MNALGTSGIALFLILGTALGAVYFTALLQAVRLHAARAPALRVVALHVLRFAAAVSGFYFVAQQGAAPLLLTLLGFMGARVAVQRWALPE